MTRALSQRAPTHRPRPLTTPRRMLAQCTRTWRLCRILILRPVPTSQPLARTALRRTRVCQSYERGCSSLRSDSERKPGVAWLGPMCYIPSPGYCVHCGVRWFTTPIDVLDICNTHFLSMYHVFGEAMDSPTDGHAR